MNNFTHYSLIVENDTVLCVCVGGGEGWLGGGGWGGGVAGCVIARACRQT